MLHSSKLIAVDFSPWQDAGSATQSGPAFVVIELDHDVLVAVVCSVGDNSVGVESDARVVAMVRMPGSEFVDEFEEVLVVGNLVVDVAACEDPRNAVVAALVVVVDCNVASAVVATGKFVVGSRVTDCVDGK